MADIANRDEAHKCLEIAERALAAGELGKAEKFVQKASKLYHNAEVDALARKIRAAATRQYQQQQEQEQPQHHHQNHHSRSHGHSHAHENGASTSSQQQHHGASTGQRGSAQGDASTSRGASTGEGLRHRHGPSLPKKPEKPAEDPGTPEQKALVAQILKAKDLYAILGLTDKGASDDDIKKAYRKLALKLHPDKCKAHHSEEAFKAVSKAFSCLSDPDKRAYYDRTGFESSSAMAAAQQAGRAQRAAQQGPMYYESDFDPEEIFNMFFGGAFGPQTRVFRTHFGGAGMHHGGRGGQGAGGQGQQQPQDPGRAAMLSFLQFLPVLILIFFTFFSGGGSSVFSLVRDSKYPIEMRTTRLDVPYFIQNRQEFEKSYPRATSARHRVERQVESDYYEKLSNKCQQERLAQHRAWTWGNREQARGMKLEACEELDAMTRKLNTAQRASGQRYHY